MEDVEYKLKHRKNHFRQRRNMMRNVFFGIFFVVFAFGFRYFLLLPQGNIPEIIIVNNKNVNVLLLKEQLSDQIQGQNFFRLSLNKLAEEIRFKNPLVSVVIFRKYLLPGYLYIAYIVEKEVWAKACLSNDSCQYVLADGVSFDEKYLSEDFDREELCLIKTQLQPSIIKNELELLKKVFDVISKDYNLSIKEINITPEKEAVLTSEEGLLIKLGEVSPDLLSRLGKLKKALDVIHSKSIPVSYIDLRPENSIVFKEDENIEDQSEKLKDLFGRKER